MFLRKTRALDNILEKVKIWLNDLSHQHRDFKWDISLVEKILWENMLKGKNPPNEIFSGVFAAPICHDDVEDSKLVPLKLVKIESGKIIPAHLHLGEEHYLILNDSNGLIDTRSTYGEKGIRKHCISCPDELHAVMNISDQPIYVLIALPTVVKLRFLDSRKALDYFFDINAKIEKEEAYLPHHIFTRLLYAEKLLENNMLDEARIVIQDIEVSEIENHIQKTQADILKLRVCNKRINPGFE